jgi:hypothetical protein
MTVTYGGRFEPGLYIGIRRLGGRDHRRPDIFRNLLVHAAGAKEILKIAFDGSGEIIRDGERTVANHAKVQRDRLKVDSLKWTMSKLYPKRYGDKAEPEAAEEHNRITVIRWEAVSAVYDDDGCIINADDKEKLRARIKRLEERLAGKETEQPPKLLTWDPGPLPSRMDGEIVEKLVGLIKDSVPQADQRPAEEVPSEVLSICQKALEAEYGSAAAA